MPDPAFLSDQLQMLIGNPGTGALVFLLAVAAVIDYRTLRIPNWLTASGALYAFILAATDGPVAAGLGHAASGFAVGLALLLPLWLLRILGAGDVKLMAMVGAFVGAGPVVGAVLFSFVAGGLLAVVQVAAAGSWLRVANNLRAIAWSLLIPGGAAIRPALRTGGATAAVKLPYGIGICVGTTVYLAARQLGF